VEGIAAKPALGRPVECEVDLALSLETLVQFAPQEPGHDALRVVGGEVAPFEPYERTIDSHHRGCSDRDEEVGGAALPELLQKRFDRARVDVRHTHIMQHGGTRPDVSGFSASSTAVQRPAQRADPSKNHEYA
jgi:hypothetical protein